MTSDVVEARLQRRAECNSIPWALPRLTNDNRALGAKQTPDKIIGGFLLCSIAPREIMSACLNTFTKRLK
jgi:hypothetical protein